MEKSSTKGKGTVTPLASMFSPEEVQKAAKRVEDTISEKRKELETLKQFAADNSGVASLVAKLPNELSHPVMVPFGKAAFFPGQLVHTNEFMVLLGEGYFAERTGKQTVEILKRRGEALSLQMEALEANLKDLEAEASFFGKSASEAAEGLMEIREEYVEEEESQGSQPDDLKVTVEDDEYARMMSRLDELEREEVAAGDESGTDESEEISFDGGSDESDEDEEPDEAPTDGGSDLDEPDFGNLASQHHSLPQKQEPKNSQSLVGHLSKERHNPLNVTDQTNCTGLTVQPVNPVSSDRISNAQISRLVETRPPAKERVFMLPKVKENFEEIPSGKEAFTSSIMEHRSGFSSHSQVQAATSVQAPAETSKPRHDSSKAFTGSIVEHTFNLPSATSSQTSDPQPSKPVSRFKMLRK